MKKRCANKRERFYAGEFNVALYRKKKKKSKITIYGIEIYMRVILIWKLKFVLRHENQNHLSKRSSIRYRRAISFCCPVSRGTSIILCEGFSRRDVARTFNTFSRKYGTSAVYFTRENNSIPINVSFGKMLRSPSLPSAFYTSVSCYI